MDDGVTGPLAGLRVLEFGYGVAAPTCCRNLAHFGAEVIKVESARKPDSLRQSGSGWVPLEVDWKLWRDTGILLHFTSSGKRSIGLEIDKPEGRRVLEKLVAVSDCLVMNMSVEAVGHLGLTYARMRSINPALVWINMPSFGSIDGPYRGFRTWGRNIAAMAGLSRLIGWPDREPVGMNVNIVDYLSGLWSTIGVLAALAERDRTGEGCEIDLSQFQAAMACISPTVMDVQLGGDGLGTLGNRSPGRAPQGVYPCRGDEQWVAVSVLDDEMWRGLCQLEHLRTLGEDARFATADGREAHHDELDEAISAWTRARTPWEAATELQAVGVAASPVQNNFGVLSDPQLYARGQFKVVPHARFGKELVYGQGISMTGTPPVVTRAAPAFGEDTRSVLTEVAGLDDPEVDSCIEAGAAHEMPYADVHLERPYLHWVRALVQLDWPESTQVDPMAEQFERMKAWAGESGVEK